MMPPPSCPASVAAFEITVTFVIVSARPDRREIGSLLGAAYVCGKPFVVEELVGEVERAVLN